MTRTYNSIRNIAYILLVSVFTIVIGFIVQRVFINVLGAEYLGINGLFTSIVSMLSLVELGLGSAIYSHLYKPVTDKNVEKIKSIVIFYKKGYRLVAFAVSIIGLLLLPFLGTIVGNTNINDSIYVIYLLFIIDVVASYLLSYKRALLYVDQKNHIISAVHLGYLIALNISQIYVLLVTGNYYLYLVIKIFMRLVENIILNIISNKKYPYLKEKVISKLDAGTKSDIYKKVRGLSYHKVASYIVLGTDNIIISVFFGITAVGLYSNYLLVTTAIVMIISQLFTALTASVGNLLVSVKHDKTYQVYKKLRLGNFWLASVAAASLLVTMDSFITIWIGSEYLLPFGVLVAISLNLYLTLLRFSVNSFKEAAGIFHEDRFVPIIESIANIVFSIILLKLFGLAGVFLGTAFSTLILHLFSYPKFVYKPLFNQKYKLYYQEFFKCFIITAAISAITFGISRTINISGDFASFIINVLLCLTIPNIILYAIFRNNPEIKYYKSLAGKGLRNLKAKV
jgi:O-antigen/teichoic acid export membrane protein